MHILHQLERVKLRNFYQYGIFLVLSVRSSVHHHSVSNRAEILYTDSSMCLYCLAQGSLEKITCVSVLRQKFKNLVGNILGNKLRNLYAKLKLSSFQIEIGVCVDRHAER